MALPLKMLPLVAALAAAMAVSGCAPGAETGRSVVSDGVKFEYALMPTPDAKANTYHVDLALTDAKTGAQIPGATVALSMSGPGDPGGTLVNLSEASAGAYGGDISLPQAGAYNLTFQVNRKAPAPSAQAVFSAERPTGD